MAKTLEEELDELGIKKIGAPSLDDELDAIGIKKVQPDLDSELEALGIPKVKPLQEGNLFDSSPPYPKEKPQPSLFSRAGQALTEVGQELNQPVPAPPPPLTGPTMRTFTRAPGERPTLESESLIPPDPVIEAIKQSLPNYRPGMTGIETAVEIARTLGAPLSVPMAAAEGLAKTSKAEIPLKFSSKGLSGLVTAINEGSLEKGAAAIEKDKPLRDSIGEAVDSFITGGGSVDDLKNPSVAVQFISRLPKEVATEILSLQDPQYIPMLVGGMVAGHLYNAGYKAVGKPAVDAIYNRYRMAKNKERALAPLSDEQILEFYKQAPEDIRGDLVRRNVRLQEILRRSGYTEKPQKPVKETPPPAREVPIEQVPEVKIEAAQPELRPETALPPTFVPPGQPIEPGQVVRPTPAEPILAPLPPDLAKELDLAGIPKAEVTPTVPPGSPTIAPVEGKAVKATEVQQEAGKQPIPVRKAEEFKVGDVLDPQGNTNMVGEVTITGISGNTLKFTDSQGTEFAGMQRSQVRTLVNAGSWKKVEAKESAAPEIPPEVLKDYPELAKKAAKSEAPAWDSLTPEQKTDVVRKAGFVTGKGEVSQRGKNILKMTWDKLSKASRNVIEKKMGEVGKTEEIIPQKPKKEKPEKIGGIVRFVQNSGRVNPNRPDSSDIRQLGRFDLMNTKTGKSLDGMVESAIEAGYLPRGSVGSDLIAALDAEIKTGKKMVAPGEEREEVYNFFDDPKKDAEKLLAEIDKYNAKEKLTTAELEYVAELKTEAVRLLKDKMTPESDAIEPEGEANTDFEFPDEGPTVRKYSVTTEKGTYTVEAESASTVRNPSPGYKVLSVTEIKPKADAGRYTAYDVLGQGGPLVDKFNFPKGSIIEILRNKKVGGKNAFSSEELEQFFKDAYVSRDLGLFKKDFVYTAKRKSDGKLLKDIPMAHVDFNNLGGLNEKLGHVGADELFAAFARILNEQGFVAARVGGDEFVILLDPLGTEKSSPFDFFERVKKLQADLADVAVIDEATGKVKHIGLTLTGGFGKNLAEADALAYESKLTGRNKIWLDKKFIEGYNQSEGTNYEWSYDSDVAESRAEKALSGQEPEREIDSYVARKNARETEARAAKEAAAKQSAEIVPEPPKPQTEAVNLGGQIQEQPLLPGTPQREVPKTGLSKSDQVESDRLLEGFTQKEETPDLPFQGRGGGGTAFAAPMSAPTTKPVTVPEQEITDILPEAPPAPANPAYPGAPNDFVPHIEMPELYRLTKELLGSPPIAKRLRRNLGLFTNAKGIKEAEVKISLEAFKDPVEATKILAHEIGHMIDWLPDYTLKRGNILGRLKSLRNFLSTTISSLPSSEQVLSAKDRLQIRNRLTKEILSEMGKTLGDYIKSNSVREAVKPIMKERYPKAIEEAIKSGGLITKDQVVKELRAVTVYWHPFDPLTTKDSYTAYRFSSRELYAEAMSMLFNEPVRLKGMAPTFYKMFWENIDKKPEVKDALNDLETLLSKGDEIFQRREQDIRDMYEKGEKLFFEKRKERSAEKRSTWFKIKNELIDKNMAILEKLEESKKRGVKINPEDNPQYFLEEYNYLGGKLHNLYRDIDENIREPLRKADLDDVDLGMTAQLKRITTERKDIANPLGQNRMTAQKQLDYMESKQTPEQKKAIADGRAKMFSMMQEKLKEAHDLGFYNDEIFNKIVTNPDYAPFQVLDYLNDYVTAAVVHQVGTMKEIANPFTSWILKMTSLTRAIEREKVNQSIVKFMSSEFPTEIREAEYKHLGEGRREIREKEGFGIIKIHDKGVLKGYYVDPYIADSVNYSPSLHTNGILEVLRFLNRSWFRPVYVGLNLGFQLSNLMRDFQRSWKLNPNLPIYKIIQEYYRAAPSVASRVWGNNPDAIIREMHQKGMLSITYNDLLKGASAEDTQIEHLMRRYKVGAFKEEKGNAALAPFRALLTGIENFGNFIETLPKVVGYKTRLKSGRKIQEIAHDVRVYSGSPDFLRKGKGYNWHNDVFLFSNAIKEGMRGDYEGAFKDPRTRAGYWWKTVATSLFPKLLMFLAALGFAGKKAKENYDKQTEYDKTNYTTIPLGETDDGQAVYLRIPEDETGRMLGGIFWKMLNKDKDIIKAAQQVTSLSAGQIPSLSPAVGMIFAGAQYLVGQNPYDFFRGRNVLTNDEQKARGVYGAKKMGKWYLSQGGLSINWAYQDKPGEATIVKVTRNAPIVSRFIKVTDYGLKEKEREREKEREARMAGMRLSRPKVSR